jgi:hypothetical protein
MTDKQSKVPLSAIASFAAHVTEMIEDADRAELLKRHRNSLERLRDGLARLLDR